MVMIRPKGKPLKIAQNVLKNKGIKVKGGPKMEKETLKEPYLQH